MIMNTFSNYVKNHLEKFGQQMLYLKPWYEMCENDTKPLVSIFSTQI